MHGEKVQVYKFRMGEDKVKTYGMKGFFQGAVERKDSNVYISEKVKYRLKVRKGEPYWLHHYGACFIPNRNKQSVAIFGSLYCSFEDSIRVLTFSDDYTSVEEDFKQTVDLNYDSAMWNMKWTKNKKLWGFGYTVCRNYLILFGGCLDDYTEYFDKIYFFEFTKPTGSWNLSVNVCLVMLAVYTLFVVLSMFVCLYVCWVDATIEIAKEST